MKREAFESLKKAEHSWWYRGRALAIRSMLTRAKISKVTSSLDFGAGFGGSFNELKRMSDSVYAFEPEKEARDVASSRGYKSILESVDQVLQHQYDLIALLDVIEHIEDDVNILKLLGDSLNSNGYLIITVPAFPFLWSIHDVDHMHYRRYTRKTLVETLNKAGYKIVVMSHWDILLFFPAFLIRRSGKSGTGSFNLPKIIDTFIVSVLFVEALLIRYISSPFGISIVAVAKKREDLA